MTTNKTQNSRNEQSNKSANYNEKNSTNKQSEKGRAGHETPTTAKERDNK